MNQIPHYPLGEQARSIKSASSKPVEEFTMANLMAGNLSQEDLRIHAETLHAQAEIARQAGYHRLAENLIRAAELTRVPNTLLLSIYEALRPGRSTEEELSSLAGRLENEFQAPNCAAFIRQAIKVYQQCGLIHTP